MSILMSTNKYKEKIEAKFAKPIKIDFEKKEEIKKSQTIDPQKLINSTLMIGEGVTISGNIKAKKEVSIQGVVEGDIECNSINVNQSGKIVGNVKAEKMRVEGYIEGEVQVNDILTVKSTGNINGKINYGAIQIDEGGKILGTINFKDKDNKQEEFENWKNL